jgi:hypothetical protein
MKSGGFEVYTCATAGITAPNMRRTRREHVEGCSGPLTPARHDAAPPKVAELPVSERMCSLWLNLLGHDAFGGLRRLNQLHRKTGGTQNETCRATRFASLRSCVSERLLRAKSIVVSTACQTPGCVYTKMWLCSEGDQCPSAGEDRKTVIYGQLRRTRNAIAAVPEPSGSARSPTLVWDAQSELATLDVDRICYLLWRMSRLHPFYCYIPQRRR